MSNQSPLVSVVVPTYYRNDLLQETLESIQSQSYSPLEIIVVDDSGDGHAKPVVSHREEITYVELDQNLGSNRARTVGARRAEGTYLHFVDDDDRMTESKIEHQVRVIEANPDVGVVYTGIEKTGGRVDRPDPAVRGSVLEHALAFEMWPCMTSTMLIRADILETLLPFPDLPGADDFDLMISLAVETQFEFVADPLLFKRIDMDSLGSSDGAVDGRKQVMNRHADLYRECPDRIRRTALANTYETEGALCLRKDGWSPRAIGALLRHFYYEPDEKPKSLIKVVAACFGSPGWNAIDRLNQLLAS